MARGRILVVDDNSGIRSALKLFLPDHFSDVETLPSPKELMSTIANFRPDAVLLDMNFVSDINTGNEGLYWLSEIKAHYPEVQVVLFTAYADISLAVEGMKRGAFDFIVKPWENAKLVRTLSEAVDASRRNSGKRVPERSSAAVYWGSGEAHNRRKRKGRKDAIGGLHTGSSFRQGSEYHRIERYQRSDGRV